jgi:transcriptional regulator with XRE-family HTH domain
MTRRAAPRHETPSPLGDVIRRLRDERHLTLGALARISGTSEQNLSNWEAGRRPRRRADVEALDVALDAGGQLVQAYVGSSGLPERIAELEHRIADLELARDRALPTITENAAELTRLWDQVRQLAGAVQLLADRGQRKPGSPRSPAR